MTKRPKRQPRSPAGKPPLSRNVALIWLTVVGLPVLLAAIVAYVVFGRVNQPAPTPIATADQPALVEQVESLYNDISVYRRSDGDLMLLFGAKRLHYIESIVNPNDPLDLPVTYTQSMVAGALAFPAELKDAMIIGLGGGRTSWYLHKSVPDLSYTAVELDPEVAHLADKYFAVKPEPNFNLEINDGRVWLTKTDKTYDVILIDAYRGPFVPFHLLTSEFYKLVAAHLKPGGVAVQNVEPSTMLFDSAVATIRSAFEHLVFLSGDGNIVIVAYNGPEKTAAEVQQMATERQAKYGFRYDLPTLIADRVYAPRWDENAKVLTDDFAPVEYLKAIERHNEKQPS
ncbi:MAG TPA: fused MFS/spermidine synthase [Bauldia sp.]|nr:fused MFS/spermidine synthase [Bauldia sp.]